MRFALTYDLREEYLAAGYSREETAEFDRPDTIEAIEGALQALGHSTERIGHGRALAARLAAGDRWDMVFNIAEGLRGFGREAQVPALLDLYEVPYTFSDPLVLALALHKGMANHVVRDLGIPTAEFAVVGDEADLAALIAEARPRRSRRGSRAPLDHSHAERAEAAEGDAERQSGVEIRNRQSGIGNRLPLAYPLFVKPVAEGTGKGITRGSKVSSPRRLAAACRAVWRRFRQPALVETYLPGREFTVGVLGTGPKARAIGTLEIVLRKGAEAHAYSYENKEDCERRVDYVLVKDALAKQAEELAVAVWRGLGCRDAGRVDFRADAAGRPRFLEVNPLAGLHPEHSDLPILCTQVGIPYVSLIGQIVESACERLPRRGRAR